MKILFLTPRVRPVIEGIGDYTWNLVEALRRRGIDAHLITSRGQAAGPSWLHPLIERWEKKQMAAAVQSFSPDWISLQYSAPLYGRYGICPEIPSALSFLRRQLKCRVTVTFHEFTMEKKLDPKILFLKWILDRQTSKLMKSSDAAIGTCASHVKLLTGLNTACGVSSIPVGANILPCEISKDKIESLRQRHGLENAKVLTAFGRLSGFRSYPLALQALALAREQGIPAFLLLLGALRSSNPVLYEELLISARRSGIEKYLIETGDLNAEDVSAYLRLTDVFLFPQEDGISTRNTTVMSALAHGLPVVAYAPVPGNYDGYEVPYGSLVPRGNQTAFARAAVDLLRKSAGGREKSALNQRYFADHFSWEKIAEKYTRILKSAPSSEERP